MIRRVLVTRPDPDGRDTAQRLQAMGYDALVLPLTKIVALPEQTSALAPIDSVVVTSSNALRHVSKHVVSSLLGKNCFAVGDRTAAMAREAGFVSVISANGHADALAKLVIARCDRAARIAYLCGTVRRPDFEAAMAQAGRTVVPIVTYDTLRLLPSDSEIETALGGGVVDAVLVYSAESAMVLAELMKRPVGSRRLSNAMFCCLSARVAAALSVAPSQIRIAERPEQTALFDVLKAGG